MLKRGESTVYTIGDYEAKKFVQTKLELLETDIYDKEYTALDVAAMKFSRNGKLLLMQHQKKKEQNGFFHTR